MARVKGSRKYTDQDIIDAIREDAEQRGRAATYDEWMQEHLLPSMYVIRNQMGTWSNALVAAGVEAEGYESHRKWEENEACLARVRAGETLREIAADLGVSSQALGRRLRRHVLATGSDPVPVRERSGNAARGRRTGGLWAAA